MVIEAKSREPATAEALREPQAAAKEGLTPARVEELKGRVDGPGEGTFGSSPSSQIARIASQLWGYVSAIDGWVGGKPASKLDRERLAQFENDGRSELRYMPF